VGTGPDSCRALARAYPSATVTASTPPGDARPGPREARASGVADRVRLVEGTPMTCRSLTRHLTSSSPRARYTCSTTCRASSARRTGAEARRKPRGVDQRRDVALPIYAVAWGSTLALRVLGKPSTHGPVIDACYTKGELQAALSSAGFARHEVSAGVLALEPGADVTRSPWCASMRGFEPARQPDAAFLGYTGTHARGLRPNQFDRAACRESALTSRHPSGLASTPRSLTILHT